MSGDELISASLRARKLEDISLDYERLEVTIVMLHDRVLNRYVNVFSTAELCPREQPRSKDLRSSGAGNSNKDVRVSLSPERTLYVRRVFSDDPMEGVLFYRGAGDTRNVASDTHGPDLWSPSAMTEEPPNETPVIVQSDETSTLSAVLPYRPGGMRACIKLDMEGAVAKLVPSTEMIKMGEVVNDLLGVDLLKYREFVGAVILCFPDPCLRRLHVQLSVGGQALLVNLFTRVGASVMGRWLEFVDDRPLGTGFQARVHVTANSFVVPIPCKPERLYTRMYDTSGDLIYVSSGYFIGHVTTQIGINGSTRRVTFQRDNGTETLEIPTVSYQESPKIAPSVPAKLEERNQERMLDALEQNRTFLFFEGGPKSKERARIIIRELLGSAKRRCIICDPYIAANDVTEYGLFVSSTNVVIQLLGSKEYLRSTVVRDDAGAAQISEAERLFELINQLRTQDTSLQIECRALKGREKSPLHDRFMVIDDEVYLLGSSLNEFGSRATTMFRVPDARPLIKISKDWWYSDEASVGLSTWVSELRQHKGETHGDE